jgi:hypothetical protein
VFTEEFDRLRIARIKLVQLSVAFGGATSGGLTHRRPFVALLLVAPRKPIAAQSAAHGGNRPMAAAQVTASDPNIPLTDIRPMSTLRADGHIAAELLICVGATRHNSRLGAGSRAGFRRCTRWQQWTGQSFQNI